MFKKLLLSLCLMSSTVLGSEAIVEIPRTTETLLVKDPTVQISDVAQLGRHFQPGDPCKPNFVFNASFNGSIQFRDRALIKLDTTEVLNIVLFNIVEEATLKVRPLNNADAFQVHRAFVPFSATWCDLGLLSSMEIPKRMTAGLHYSLDFQSHGGGDSSAFLEIDVTEDWKKWPSQEFPNGWLIQEQDPFTQAGYNRNGTFSTDPTGNPAVDILFQAQCEVVYYPLVRGDMDSNGFYDTNDAKLLSEFIAQGQHSEISDVNNDGFTTFADLQELVQDDPDILASILGDLTGPGGNMDHLVNFTDFLVLAANYGGPGDYTLGDCANANGVIDFSDFLKLSSNYGNTH